MGYFWKNWHQEVSYNWTGFMSLFAYRPKWTNPTSDMPNRTNLASLGIVTDSEPVDWPEEYQGGRINTAVRQKVWMGSVGGIPVQRVDPMRVRRFTIINRWGGYLVRDGVDQGYLNSGQTWEVDVPVPVRLAEDGWAVEAYPNAGNDGDRHWYGVEDNGTHHEAIWIVTDEHFALGRWSGSGNTMLDYCKYAPDGTLLTGVSSRTGYAGVVKGCVSWLSLAWQRGDSPHLLGMAMNNLARDGYNGAPSDGDRDDWEHPAYGRHYRLSPEAYTRLSVNADSEQQTFLDAIFHYGIIPYDRGGATSSTLGAGVGMVAGAQHVGSTLPQLDIKVSDLELVTETDR